MSRPVLSDLDFGGAARALNLPAPQQTAEAATKGYVDSAVEGLAWKDSVRVASVANINLAAPGAAVNGVNLAANDRFLAKDQTAPAENGIYIWNGAATPATRSADASTFDELEQAVTTVEEGTSAGATYRQTAINGTIGVTAVAWTNFGTAAPNATETVAGVAEIATQGEADAGTDDARIVTPLKLAAWAGRKLKTAALIGDGAATSYNLDHNFGTRDVAVSVYKNSGNYDDVLVDVTRPSVNRVTLTFAAAPAANAYRVVVIG
jgi:hypothetical protein